MPAPLAKIKMKNQSFVYYKERSGPESIFIITYQASNPIGLGDYFLKPLPFSIKVSGSTDTAGLSAPFPLSPL